MRTPRNWLITGISRGLGRALAEAALAQGDTVIGTTRSGWLEPPRAPKLRVLALDSADPEQVRPAVREALRLCRRLDVVVNNAGYGLFGAVEEAAVPQAYELFSTNFFGAWHLIQEVLPALRAQRHGHIVNISSVAALSPHPGSGLYAASKAALEGMSESLAAELAPLGIKVSLVEPGALRTDFLSERSMQVASRHIGDYAEPIGRVVRHKQELSGHQPGDPDAAAQAILELLDLPEPPLRLLLGSDALRLARRKLAQLAGDIDRWEGLTRSVDFAEEHA
ncbi:MAG: SDR family NAD(P)-dependent oxidoreductase [Nevskia sp.]|nr:SDR family NAD(P)-dependent oxidoreductase [Nevskia sp.]